MSKQIPSGTTADRMSIGLQPGKLFFDTTLMQLFIGNGSPGGINAVKASKPFDPLSRFTGGKQGILAYASDFTNQFQDMAGSIPVTAVGQTVRRINDQSGNGNFITVAGAGCTIQYDGINYYWQNDGSASLGSAAFAWGAGTATICFAYKSDVAQQSSIRFITFGRPIASGQYGSWIIELDNGGVFSARKGSIDSSGFMYTQDLGITTQIISCVFDLSGTTTPTENPFLRVNGVSPSTTVGGVGDTGTGPFQTWTIGTGGYVGRMYALFAVADTSNAGQLSQIEQWAAMKAGISL